MLTAACGASTVDGAGGHSSVAAVAATSGPAPSPAQPTFEIYAVPPTSGPSDAKLYVQEVGGTSPTQVGTGVAASTFPNGPEGPAAILFGSHGSPTLVSPGAASALATTPTTLAGAATTQPGSVLAMAGDNYFQQTGNAITEVSSTTGATSASYSLHSLTPDPVAGSLPPYDKGLITNSTVGQVSALVASSGDWLAVQYTGRAAAIDNLTTGQEASLSGYSALGGGVLGSDGDLYVVAWNAADQTSPMEVVQFDPSTMSVVHTMSTGLSPGPTDNVQTVADGTSGILVYITQGGPSTPMESHLWTAAHGQLTQVRSLPAGVGLYMSIFRSTAYLYGGPARSDVSEVDLTTDSLSSDVAMATPAGSYVLAVG
ncbi:MAG: hypothetical protein ACYDEN_05085 [Acidimicrobiales bacterium]